MAQTKIQPSNIVIKNTEQAKVQFSEAPHSVTEQKEKTSTASLHKKPKKKQHRKVRTIRDPQQIKELRLQRINIKREVQWNNRFINDTIPQLFKPKKRKTHQVHRSRPLQSAYVDSQRPLLPQLNNPRIESKNRAFKIRNLKKEAQSMPKPKEEHFLKAKEMKEDPVEAQKQTITKKLTRKAKKRERLLLKLQEKTKLFPINAQYKALLIDLIHKSTDKKFKPVRITIEKEIQSIGALDNTYSHLQKLAEERKAMLKTVKAQPANLKAFTDLQLHSLALVQEILKFKAKWQAIYHDTLHHPTRVHFYLGDKNYLLQMNKEVENISQNDPFLVMQTSILKAHSQQNHQTESVKERMLKIRACELLLIEEELLSTP